MRHSSEKAFTLAELVVTVAILAFVLIGMIRLFIYSSVQAELAGNLTIAISEAQDKIEEIRNHTYDDIATDYVSGGTPGDVFDTTRLPGKGFIHIDPSNAELLVIEVAICWRDKYGRVLGEDQNLDGVLTSSEDINNDTKVDSPVKIVTMLTRR